MFKEAYLAEMEHFVECVRVGVAPNMGCGRCEMCGRGLANMCPDYSAFGIDRDGSHTEFVCIPTVALAQGNVIPLSPGVSPVEAALAEPLSCVVNGMRAAQLRAGDAVLIYGAGPMGLLAPFGRLNLFAGLPSGESSAELNTNAIHYQNLIVTGMTGGAPQDYRTALKLIESGRIDVRKIVSHVFASLGALVTTHKIDLPRACRDQFDELDEYADLMGEASCISKRDGQLVAHAKDPLTTGLSLEAFLPKRHWEQTGPGMFPTNGIDWEFNYRGDLVFRKQARAQQKERNLVIEDGWIYFIHGWTRVVAEVFHVDIPVKGPKFDELYRIAASERR